MANNQDKLEELNARMDTLLKQQSGFNRELRDLYQEIEKLKNPEESIDPEIAEEKFFLPKEHKPVREEPVVEEKHEPLQKQPATSISDHKEALQFDPKLRAPKKSGQKSDIEKFIGENLISKIGIIITVIGVAIGAKYSIEHDLISPLTRIILGYLMGVGLLGFGLKLKEKYEKYSAVLVSGAMAIMYFITYASYSFYDLFPQAMAFGLMVVFTAFTVLAAIKYNQQVIAHIGLVGAYTVPFLLSDGSGRVAILFTYMALINVGILVIAFKKYWKTLYYSSFAITWLIFSTWNLDSYSPSKHFSIALVFLSVFFAVFYATFLAYKLLRKEMFGLPDVILILINSFIFYGLGYMTLNSHPTGTHLLGVFTLINAIIHFAVSTVIYKKKLADRNLFYMIIGMVLVFITIAIPVQLDGNWVTLVWAGEGALLFWIGRSKGVTIYERLSYAVMILALASILQDWEKAYNLSYSYQDSFNLTPILNIHFLTSALFIAAFGFINVIHQKFKINDASAFQSSFQPLLSISLPAILISVVFASFYLEIDFYFRQWYAQSAVNYIKEGPDYAYPIFNNDLRWFQSVWLINYSLVFIALLSLINFKKIKNEVLEQACLVLSLIAVLTFLSKGLFALSELREGYLKNLQIEYFSKTSVNLWLRYVSFIFVGIVVWMVYLSRPRKSTNLDFKLLFDLFIYSAILWVASSELIHWMDIAGFNSTYKLGLSILWGSYSLMLIAIGLWKNKKHLRIGAIGLFAITLIKLFFYDIAQLNTISKTVVFVSLGVLLLIISFLYNKFKLAITDEDEK